MLHGMDHNMWNGSGVLSRINVRHRRSTKASDPKTNTYLYFFAVFQNIQRIKTNEFCVSLGECTKDRKDNPPPDKKKSVPERFEAFEGHFRDSFVNSRYIFN